MVKLNPNHIRLTQDQRLYRCPVPIVGLTGSIATGKSSVTKILRQLGHSVIDADKLIKDIYTQPDVIDFIKQNCPEAIVNEVIDFKVLRIKFFSDKELALKLENKLYSYLPEAFNNSLNALLKNTPSFILYDVPLLFEKGIGDKVDTIVTVYAPKEIQLKRLMARDNIDHDIALKLISNQIDIEQKKQNSHLIIDNSLTIENLPGHVEKFLQILEKK